jgi:hypothetical protein
MRKNLTWCSILWISWKRRYVIAIEIIIIKKIWPIRVIIGSIPIRGSPFSACLIE